MENGWWRNSLIMRGTTTNTNITTGGGDDVNIITTNQLPPPPFSPAVGVTSGRASGGCYHDWRTDTTTTASTTRVPSVIHELLFNNNNTTSFHHDARSVMPADPHMICLKLGKRHYCEDAVVPTHPPPTTADDVVLTKRAAAKQQQQQQQQQPPSYPRPYGYGPSYGDYVTSTHDITAAGATAATSTAAVMWPSASSSHSPRVTSVVPRCQVEGCHVVLSNTTKEYYRRHKVCEIHSKSPKVVVLGLLQRFCQQCSRFHKVTEFDEAKRSCRRRLEGHNQRRRKGSLSHSLPQNFPHSRDNSCMIMERRLQPSPPQSKPGCAPSLLSSPETEPWISPDALSSRCSEALYELIVANRATSVVTHRLNQDSFHQSDVKNTMHSTLPETQMWNGFGDHTDHTAMTLDLKQAPAVNYGLLSVKEKAKNPEEWTDYCWSAFGGSSVV